MPYSYTLSTTLPASPREIYDAWLDSVGHSEMTGGQASMSDELGAEISAWGGYITGRNVELVPGERIVQSWRTTQFTDAHEDSTITVLLEPVEGGTLLTLVHSNVPDDQTSYEQGGWHEHYFEPMLLYFAETEVAEAEEPPPPSPQRKAASPKAKAKPAARPAKASGRPKRAAKAKSPSASKRKTAGAKKSAGKKAAGKKAPGKKAAGTKAARRGAGSTPSQKRGKGAKRGKTARARRGRRK